MAKRMKRPTPEGREMSTSKRPSRRLVASLASQGSFQNALGISFGKAATLSSTINNQGPESKMADLQEDSGGKIKKAKHISDEKVPDQVSIPSGNEVVQIPNDVKARLGNKVFVFNHQEFKTIVRWMRMYRAHKATHHKAQFSQLAESLGYADALLSPEAHLLLRAKLRSKLASLHVNMKKSGALPDADGYESPSSNVFQPLAFAEWTLMWYKKGWDGSINKPDQAKYEKVMNEPDDDVPVTSDGVNDKDRGGKWEEQAGRGEQQGPNAQRRRKGLDRACKSRSRGQVSEEVPSVPIPTEAAAPAEPQPQVGKSHRDDDYDGIEIFVVEEHPRPPEGEVPPPPKEDDFPEAKAWNKYLVNKEIIDAKDWNYRVMVAQNLGLNLNDLAVLYDDPFPGYEAPAREDSAPPATDTRTAPSTTPSTPAVHRSTTVGTKTAVPLSRSASDESISIGSVDSEDEVEILEKIVEEQVSGEEIGDHEMEDEDLEDEDLEDQDQEGEYEYEDQEDQEDEVGVDMENGHESQASSARAVRTRVDTEASFFEPRTPRRSTSRQSVTPGSGSGTPVFAAIWSPKE